MDKLFIKDDKNIAGVGYDQEAMTLEIKFHSGGTYQYWPVTETGWKLLLKSENKAQFFAKHFRKNPSINYKRVDNIQSD